MDEFFRWLSNNPPATYVLIAAFSSLIILFVVVFLVGFLQGRELQFWPPRIGSRPPSSKARTVRRGKSVPKARSDSVSALDPRLKHFAPSIPSSFITLDLPFDKTPKTYGRPHCPIGVFVVYDIPFRLVPEFNQSTHDYEHAIIDISPDIQTNLPSVVSVPVSLSNVEKVHFLITAGHGRVSYQGVEFVKRRIGYLELRFSNDAVQKEYLVLGANIREWAYGSEHEIVEELDHSLARPVWLSHDRFCLLDLLSVKVEQFPNQLESIHVVAEFEERIPGIMKPVVRVSAITCELSAG
jgi:hypothetical protein